LTFVLTLDGANRKAPMVYEVHLRSSQHAIDLMGVICGSFAVAQPGAMTTWLPLVICNCCEEDALQGMLVFTIGSIQCPCSSPQKRGREVGDKELRQRTTGYMSKPLKGPPCSQNLLGRNRVRSKMSRIMMTRHLFCSDKCLSKIGSFVPSVFNQMINDHDEYLYGKQSQCTLHSRVLTHQLQALDRR